MIVTVALTLGFKKSDQSCQRLRHRSVAHHADDDRAALHRHAAKSGNGAWRQDRRGAVIVVDAAFFSANLQRLRTGAMSRYCLRS